MLLLIWSSFPLSQHLKIRITWIYSAALFWPEGKAFLNYYSSGLKKKSQNCKTCRGFWKDFNSDLDEGQTTRCLWSSANVCLCPCFLFFQSCSCKAILWTGEPVLSRKWCGWNTDTWVLMPSLDYWSWENFWVGALVQAKMCSYEKSCWSERMYLRIFVPFSTDVQTPWPLLQCWEWARVPYGGQLAPVSAFEEQRSQSLLPVTSVLRVLGIAVFVRSPFC